MDTGDTRMTALVTRDLGDAVVKKPRELFLLLDLP